MIIITSMRKVKMPFKKYDSKKGLSLPGSQRLKPPAGKTRSRLSKPTAKPLRLESGLRVLESP